MRIWSVSLFLKIPYCTSSSWWREVIKSLWDEITWGEWHGHHDACWAIIDLLTVCQEEDPLLPNSKLTAGNWNHRKCNHREGRLLYLVSVMTVILNLLFLLYLRLVSAIFALLTLQFQLPHHIPICNCNKPNGSCGKYCSACLLASETYPTECASVSHWGKRRAVSHPGDQIN